MFITLIKSTKLKQFVIFPAVSPRRVKSFVFHTQTKEFALKFFVDYTFMRMAFLKPMSDGKNIKKRI